MENKQVKLCKDCKYHAKDKFSGSCDICTQRIYYTVDIVTGEKIENNTAMSCYTNREISGSVYCEREGKFWEQKQSLFSKILSYFRS